jgi:transcriptional regulator with XRE-family HTH domain
MGAVTQVPAAPVRSHVVGLIDSGMSQAAICRAAGVSSAYLSALLYGQFMPGRPPQKAMRAEIAARLLAVSYDGPEPKAAPTLCAPGERFEPVGYRVGRCQDCGQIAPVQTRGDRILMFGHPRPVGADQEPGALPVPAGHAHSSCGWPKGYERHRREHTVYCEPCKGARRGYEQGWDAAMAKVRKAGPGVPVEQAEAVVAAMRAFLYRRPYPQLLELARTVVRRAS